MPGKIMPGKIQSSCLEKIQPSARKKSSHLPGKIQPSAWKNPGTEAQTWKNPGMIFSKPGKIQAKTWKNKRWKHACQVENRHAYKLVVRVTVLFLLFKIGRIFTQLTSFRTFLGKKSAAGAKISRFYTFFD